MDIKLEVNIYNFKENEIEKIFKDISKKENIDIKDLDEYDCIFEEFRTLIKQAITNKYPNINIGIYTMENF